MTGNWIKLALAISLVFNLFFAAGFAMSRSGKAWHHRSIERRAKWFTRQLDLDDNQQAVFDKLLAETIKNHKESRQENLPQLERMLDELVKDNPDQQVLQEYASFDRRKAHREFKIQQMAKFMAVLRPDQRKKCAELFLERIKRKFEHKSCH